MFLIVSCRKTDKKEINNENNINTVLENKISGKTYYEAKEGISFEGSTTYYDTWKFNTDKSINITYSDVVSSSSYSCYWSIVGDSLLIDQKIITSKTKYEHYKIKECNDTMLILQQTQKYQTSSDKPSIDTTFFKKLYTKKIKL